MSNETEVNLWVLTCLWFIPWSISFCVFAYYLFTKYFEWRLSTYGTPTNAEIIQVWTQNRETNSNATSSWWMEYKYYDKRDEITTNHMILTLNKLKPKEILIPIEIINLCIAYLGESFEFYFGPYTLETKIPLSYYNEHRYPKDPTYFTIMYDPQYPNNVRVTEGNIVNYYKYYYNECCSWQWTMISNFVLMMVMIMGIYFTLNGSSWSHRGYEGVMGIIFGLSVATTLCVMSCVKCLSKRSKTRKDLGTTLQCECVKYLEEL